MTRCRSQFVPVPVTESGSPGRCFWWLWFHIIWLQQKWKQWCKLGFWSQAVMRVLCGAHVWKASLLGTRGSRKDAWNKLSLGFGLRGWFKETLLGIIHQPGWGLRVWGLALRTSQNLKDSKAWWRFPGQAWWTMPTILTACPLPSLSTRAGLDQAVLSPYLTKSHDSPTVYYPDTRRG